MAKQQRAQQIADPPELPKTLAELDRAVVLLGILAKSQPMKKATLDELRLLLGAVPQPTTAGAWKTRLKQVRDEYA